MTAAIDDLGTGAELIDKAAELLQQAAEHSEEEDRFILPGLSSAARPLVVVHCYKESNSMIRIISARKATKKEFIFYEEGI